MHPPPYIIFPTYEDDGFNAMSPPPIYKVEVVLRITTEDDEIVGNENGDDSGEEDEDDDARDDEDLDPHWLPDEEIFFLLTTVYCPKMKMTGTIHLVLPTAKRNTWYFIHVSISC